MTTLTTYPLDVRGFIVETLRLPPIAKAAYLMILLDYCARGEPPPANEAVLCQIIGLPMPMPVHIMQLLSSLFEIRDGRWYHAGIEAELERVAKVQANAVRASSIAGSKRRKEVSGTPIPAQPNPPLDQIGQNQPPPLPTQNNPNPPQAEVAIPPGMEPISEDFVLTGDDVIECQNRGASVDEIADWLDYFRGYHLKAGTLAEDWTALWFRLVDRKIEERDKASRKAKPRIEVSRRAPPPPAQ